MEASLAMRCCCRRPKRRPHADALAAHKPTTVDDDMPFSTPEEEAPRCLPISPLSPWKLSWDLFQLVCGQQCRPQPWLGFASSVCVQGCFECSR